MPLNYLLKRLGVFLIIVWAGITINFIMPRLAPVNPIQERLLIGTDSCRGGLLHL